MSRLPDSGTLQTWFPSLPRAGRCVWLTKCRANADRYAGRWEVQEILCCRRMISRKTTPQAITYQGTALRLCKMGVPPSRPEVLLASECVPYMSRTVSAEHAHWRCLRLLPIVHVQGTELEAEPLDIQARQPGTPRPGPRKWPECYCKDSARALNLLVNATRNASLDSSPSHLAITLFGNYSGGRARTS